MKRSKGSALKAPIIAVTKIELGDHEDWYTPKVLKCSPLKISVTAGRKGEGRVRCVIGEGEWERRHVDLSLIFEKAPVRGEHYSICDMHSDISNEFGSGEAGTFTAEQIDRLIHVLEVARDEAKRRGLFTPRSLPKVKFA